MYSVSKELEITSAKALERDPCKVILLRTVHQNFSTTSNWH